MTSILGLNAHHSDAAARLTIDGEFAGTVKETRFHRTEHSGLLALAER